MKDETLFPDEQLAFEKFMEDNFRDLIDRRHVKNGDGGYFAWDMVVAWIVWQGRAAIQSGNSAQPVTVPAGYVLVPVEPTPEMMLHKSGCQHHTWNNPDCPMRETRRLVWSHMLAAAPKAPDGWIPVSERMPPCKTGVLVATEMDGPGDWRMKWAAYIPGHPDAINGWLIPGASWTPSHWQPLPDAPKVTP